MELLINSLSVVQISIKHFTAMMDEQFNCYPLPQSKYEKDIKLVTNDNNNLLNRFYFHGFIFISNEKQHVKI